VYRAIRPYALVRPSPRSRCLSTSPFRCRASPGSDRAQPVAHPPSPLSPVAHPHALRVIDYIEITPRVHRDYIVMRNSTRRFSI
jgi:hypothetical protein